MGIQPRAANFTIVAVEASAESPKQSVAGVTVHLRDRNDNSPEFSRERYEVEIPEDARPGATIAAVRAIDKDSGLLGTDGIRYTRISGPVAGFLHLDERTGIQGGPSASGKNYVDTKFEVAFSCKFTT